MCELLSELNLLVKFNTFFRKSRPGGRRKELILIVSLVEKEKNMVNIFCRKKKLKTVRKEKEKEKKGKEFQMSFENSESL